jgi:diaminopimelate epimerase
VGTNVNFFQGDSEQSLSVRTYERGVEDLTLACGTGAIASALTWHRVQQGNAGNHTYTVEVEGGTLRVSFTYKQASDLYSNLKLGGPAHFVFEGTYYI